MRRHQGGWSGIRLQGRERGLEGEDSVSTQVLANCLTVLMQEVHGWWCRVGRGGTVCLPVTDLFLLHLPASLLLRLRMQS